MNKDTANCSQGAVVVASATTTDSPYTIDTDGIKFRNQLVLKMLRTEGSWFSDPQPIINLHDQVLITKALNEAYQRGYKAGFKAPKYIDYNI